MTHPDLLYRRTATCECGYSGSLAAMAVHSCYVQEMGGRCEDYPACGHTDGDGCQTLPEHTSAYWTEGPGRAHINCSHEDGLFECEYDQDDDN